MVTGPAFELPARGDLVSPDAAATRAYGFPVRLIPADPAKRLIRPVLAHLIDGFEGQRARLR